MIDPILAIDFYKTGHIKQYPKGTTEVYSNFTARSDKYFKERYQNYIEVVFFGLSHFIQSFLIENFNENFFKKDKYEIITKYEKIMDDSLGKGSVSMKHIESLHDLGYLPIEIKALQEGSVVQIGVPLLTIVNTHPDFFWLTNYLETALSACLWKPITVATLARQYKLLLSEYAEMTGADKDFVNFQAHDFSSRGMSGLEDSAICGAAHLTSFYGTDAVLGIDLVKNYYNGFGAVGYSVPATEHSVMCMGSKYGEFETFKRLITEVYPTGIVSIVSDTWDFWKVVTEYLPKLKDEILNRDGKVVIRPDSGDPLRIICGEDYDPEFMGIYPNSPYPKVGLIRSLWDIFGGTINEEGYKVLNPKIGAIYGDSITLEKAYSILHRLMLLGFASSNIVFGIGSYSYNYITRDTLGFAVKATSGVINGERINIFKDPITDDGIKKSLKGLIRVEKVEGKKGRYDTHYVVFDNQTEEEEKRGELKTVFLNGSQILKPLFSDIRNIINGYLK